MRRAAKVYDRVLSDVDTHPETSESLSFMD